MINGEITEETTQSNLKRINMLFQDIDIEGEDNYCSRNTLRCL